MEPQLVTLSGDYQQSYDTGIEFLSRKKRYRKNRAVYSELMGASVWGGLKNFGSSIVNVVTAPFKGVGHFVMEAGRGISRGDIARVASSPFKGFAHSGLSLGRASGRHLEYYWRPSKARLWMKPVGGALTALGMVPVLGAPFLVAGALVSIGGGLTEGIYQGDQAKKAREANDVQALAKVEADKKRNQQYIMVAGVLTAGIIGYTMLS